MNSAASVANRTVTHVPSERKEVGYCHLNTNMLNFDYEYQLKIDGDNNHRHLHDCPFAELFSHIIRVFRLPSGF